MTGIDNLPDEIICQIISKFTNAMDIQRVLSIDRRFRDLARISITCIQSTGIRRGYSLESSTNTRSNELDEGRIPVQLALSLQNLGFIEVPIRISGTHDLTAIATQLPRLRSAILYLDRESDDYAFLCMRVKPYRNNYPDYSLTAKMLRIFIDGYISGYYIDTTTGRVKQHQRDFSRASFTFKSFIDIDWWNKPQGIMRNNTVQFSISINGGFISHGLEPCPGDRSTTSDLWGSQALTSSTMKAYMHSLVAILPLFIKIGIHFKLALPLIGLGSLSDSSIMPYLENLRHIVLYLPDKSVIAGTRFPGVICLDQCSNLTTISYCNVTSHRTMFNCHEEIIRTFNPSAPLREMLIPMRVGYASGYMARFPNTTKVAIGFYPGHSIMDSLGIFSIIKSLLASYPNLNIILSIIHCGEQGNIPPSTQCIIDRMLAFSTRISMPSPNMESKTC